MLNDHASGSMTKRGVRTLAAVFFIVNAIAVTWPGFTPFNRVYPLILGLPFSMAWIAFWVLLSMVVLWVVDRVERLDE